MDIVIVGLGSMGKRRIRLIRKHFPEIELVGVDGKADRRQQVNELYNIATFEDIDMAFKNRHYDGAFICSSPLSHAELIQKCLTNGICVFSELNLVADKYEENISLARKKKLTLFMSSTLLYRKEIQYIDEQIKRLESPIVYTYHVGQYLPDWHPWESYQDFFVGNHKTNGCREFFAIELPWIVNTFGEILEVRSVSGKNTKLHIDFDNYYVVTLIHKTGNIGTLVVDIMSREAVRHFEAFNEELYLEWRGTNDTLLKKDVLNNVLETINLYTEVDQIQGYNSTIIEDQYLAEIEAFFSELHGNGTSKYSFDKDKYILELIDKIEEKK